MQLQLDMVDMKRQATSPSDFCLLLAQRTLEKEIRSCRVLVIWTDCDREGENIGYEIIDVCQNIVPNVRIYRAKFSEITER